MCNLVNEYQLTSTALLREWKNGASVNTTLIFGVKMTLCGGSWNNDGSCVKIDSWIQTGIQITPRIYLAVCLYHFRDFLKNL